MFGYGFRILLLIHGCVRSVHFLLPCEKLPWDEDIDKLCIKITCQAVDIDVWMGVDCLYNVQNEAHISPSATLILINQGCIRTCIWKSVKLSCPYESYRLLTLNNTDMKYPRQYMFTHNDTAILWQSMRGNHEAWWIIRRNIIKCDK